MRRRIRAATALGVMCGLVLALSACGGSSSSSGSSGGGTSTTSSTLKPALTGAGQVLDNGKMGGTLNVFQHEDFQHLDPGESYFALDYAVLYVTQAPLYIFAPNSSTNIIPDLASGMPILSDGGRTVTVHIKPNVHFSPPVNRAVTSADVGLRNRPRGQPQRRESVFPFVLLLHQGRGQGDGRPDPGYFDAESDDDRFPPDRAVRFVLHRRSAVAADGSGAEVVRGAAGRQEADGVWLHVGGGDRAVHDQGRLHGQVHRDRLSAGQVPDARAKPELGPRDHARSRRI